VNPPKATLRVMLPALALVALVGCSGHSTVTADAATDVRYGNLLVIGIAGSYETRAQFERAVVSQLRRQGVQARAWHAVTGGNTPVATATVQQATGQNAFDAVLAVRRLDSDIEVEVNRSRTEIDSTPIGGRIVNLFRSNYTDYSTPASIDLSTSATIAVELYDAASAEIVYAFDHETRRETNLGLLIDNTAEAVVNRIVRSGLLAD